MLSPRTIITDFEKAAMNAVSIIFPNAQRRGVLFPPLPVFVTQNSDRWYVRRLGLQRRKLGYFEVVGVVFRTVVVAIG